ncbi:MAG: tetratricopeptide repeat protein [Proteobacteria bacterium]|nr:tetratricopeptide repeat protein [Pseudomonadota bacterium]
MKCRIAALGMLIWATSTACTPAVTLPPINEPLQSAAWQNCADEIGARTASSMIDSLKFKGSALICEAVIDAQNGNTDAALDKLNQAAVHDPDDANPHYLSGRILTEVERYEEALTAYERAEKRNTNLAIPTEEMGRRILAQRNDDEALIFLERADRRGLCDYSCQGLLGRLLYRKDRKDEAIRIFDEMIREHPDEPNAHIGIASMRNFDGDFEGESLALTRAIESLGFAQWPEAEQAKVYYSHAFARYNARKYPGAAKSIDRALRVSAPADWLLLAGWIQLQLNDAALALVQFDKSIAANARLGEAHVGRGDALMILRRQRDAALAYEAACGIDATHALWHLKHAHALAVIGNTDAAQQAYDRAVARGAENLPGDLFAKVTKLLPATDDSENEAE